jgi:hypothetical protein
VYTVKEKLTLITDLFNFYETVEMHNLIADFRRKTFVGLVKILDDCIDALDTIDLVERSN